ncbi:MAG: LCP family protein [Ruminococcus sp.]|nr:LCP family protein [Ruminococcus sp.]
MADEKDMSLEEKIANAKKLIDEEKKENDKTLDDFVLPHHDVGIDLDTIGDSEHHHHHHHSSSGHHHHHHSSSGHHHRKHRHRHHRHISKKKKKMIIFLSIVLGLLLAFLVTAGLIIHHYISKLNLIDPNDKAEIYDSINIDDLVDGPDSPKDKIDDLEKKIKANFNKDGLMQSGDVMNILLLGTDARDNSERGRSDSMILLSINKQTEEIVMTSFLRDIYLTIPGIETTRLNHAYAYGGADLAVETIEQNFKIKIDRYAQVDFTSFVKVVDAVGGVDINVTAEEVPYVNKYLIEINDIENQAQGSGNLTHSGKQTLNGRQALSYSRIRYIGTDFGRTERQRKVLEQVIKKARKLSITDLDKLLDKLLPCVTTNLTEGELFKLILKSPTYFKYDVKQCRVPVDDSYEFMTIRSMSVLGIDFKENKKYLYKNIFAVS